MHNQIGGGGGNGSPLHANYFPITAHVIVFYFLCVNFVIRYALVDSKERSCFERSILAQGSVQGIT